VQLLIGLAVTVFPAVTSAFALGMVPKEQFSPRIARNETFTHSGNVVFAVATGAVGTLLALQGIFYAAAVFAAGMAPTVFFIRKESVNHEAARQGDENGDEQSKGRTSFRDLLKDKRILIFTASIVLFYGANAATLPLVGEILTQAHHGGQSAWQISAAVVVAELVMIAVAVISGKLADLGDAKSFFSLVLWR
jgi:predicted MFS family arabinose efflux permease